MTTTKRFPISSKIYAVRKIDVRKWTQTEWAAWTWLNNRELQECQSHCSRLDKWMDE
jgi:hypothetical protein